MQTERTAKAVSSFSVMSGLYCNQRSVSQPHAFDVHLAGQLVVTRTASSYKSPIRRQQRARQDLISLIAWLTNPRENAPDLSLGVGTTTKVASVLDIVPSYLDVALSRFELFLISSSSPGSYTGETPRLMAETFDSSTSTPC